MSSERSCGTCTACCWALSRTEATMGELARPAGTACPHLRAQGCSIYATRPQLCRGYQCEHLRTGDVPRPDACGYVVTKQNSGFELTGQAVRTEYGDAQVYLDRYSVVIFDAAAGPEALTLAEMLQRRHEIVTVSHVTGSPALDTTPTPCVG